MLPMPADPGVTASAHSPLAASGRAAGRSGRLIPTESERAAAATMLRMIWGIHSSRAVYVAAKLGIADLLADGPVSTGEVALATRTVSHEVEPRSCGLTAPGDRLRSDAPAGMRSWAVFLEAIGGVRPFEHILDTVRTGTPGLDTALGTGIFQYLD